MVNPDGVNLVTGEYSNGSFAYNKAFTISKNYPNVVIEGKCLIGKK